MLPARPRQFASVSLDLLLALTEPVGDSVTDMCFSTIFGVRPNEIVSFFACFVNDVCVSLWKEKMCGGVY
jgi:hypothetical protein